MPSITWPQIVYLPLRKGAGVEDDEELAVGAVRVVRPRRADGAALEGRLVGELGRKVGIARAAGAGAGRIAGLRHEARDDAMEHDAVVEAFARELLHPLDMLWREVWAEQNGDAAVLEIEQEDIVERIGGGGRARRRGAKSQQHRGKD